MQPKEEAIFVETATVLVLGASRVMLTANMDLLGMEGFKDAGFSEPSAKCIADFGDGLLALRDGDVTSCLAYLEEILDEWRADGARYVELVFTATPKPRKKKIGKTPPFNREHSHYPHLFAVVRLDKYYDDFTENAVMVVSAWHSEEDAEREAARLNSLKPTTDSAYFVRITRLKGLAN